MSENKSVNVSEDKIKLVKELAKQIAEKNTVLLASIKGLPARQFQIIKKSLRDDADVWVVRKRAMIRAIEETKKDNLEKLKDYLKEDVALITSDKDGFELAQKLSKSKSPVKAKAGQEAPEDVEIEAGVTELPAGPAVSELGSVGLTVKVNQGKIEILENKVIVKRGQIIRDEAASVMGKLDIKPFSVGFIPEVAYDSKTALIFDDLEINPEKYANKIREEASRLNALAVYLGYICKETIGTLIAKAGRDGKALEKFEEMEEKKEEIVEEKEPVQEESEENTETKSGEEKNE